MIVSTIETVPGYEISEQQGLVFGSVVLSKHFGRDFMASLKNIVGGELHGYTELLEEGRHRAIGRMTEAAKAQGSDAVVNVRLSTSAITAGAAEIMAYGTAVKLDTRN